ncbi:hypothetical protein [Paenibacillus eucommiae]|uniref:DUF4091 domain-containing protein n=1 Tax=Paenibacillus eucommiae TaxID=1355755 RepID=A0ABS4J3S0_9BACL|nr:hypothetical protein [Paenibacillus eucommiae]MBP1994487.1 hypothetical protein [Paenibacillus eucommiae]
MKERKYEFRKRLEVVHKPDRRDPDIEPGDGEIVIGSDWQIVISRQAGPLVLQVAKDLQDYLLVSMQVPVMLHRVSQIDEMAAAGERVIVLATKEELSGVSILDIADLSGASEVPGAGIPAALGSSLTKPRSYRILAAGSRIVVCGCDDRGAGQGSYYLEDLMNLREAPFIREQDIVREPIFSPRMAHSGWGLDRYPDAHLNAMTHSGIDAILIFVEDVDRTPEGYQDFNYLVNRAALYGLDVYMYSYMTNRKHPDDPGAESYYDSTYGRIFEACPGFKGIIFVGESCEFPSKDPNTTGILRLEWPADQPQTKPSPGWWPCYDYPEWLNMLKKVIRKHNEEAEIVFWTYNWGWAPEEERLKLIRSLPEDITLQVTFEMFEQIKHEHVTNVCVDYTISFEGPGQYFSSEAQAASERGIKLYTMCNTGGLTWDIGVIPYEPVPYQWARRHAALIKAQADWGLSGLMESHHFGWWPSFVSDITKWTYWSPSPTAEDTFTAIAQRDFSKEAVPHVLEAWRHWSEGIRNYIPTNEDQYGPFRIGPSYPFTFRKKVSIPSSWHALFGSQIVSVPYEPAEGARQSLGRARYDVEIASLERMAALWRQGNACLEEALGFTSARKQEEGSRLLVMNQFIVHVVQTAIHIKQWWKLKQRLFNEPHPVMAGAILDEMEQLALQEIANAEAAIPLVNADSRLGWEPSMDYMTDEAHLRWKIAQVNSVLEDEFLNYRKSLALTDASTHQ